MSLCMSHSSFELDRSNNWFVHIHLFVFCLAYHIQLKWVESLSQHALGTFTVTDMGTGKSKLHVGSRFFKKHFLKQNSIIK